MQLSRYKRELSSAAALVALFAAYFAIKR